MPLCTPDLAAFSCRCSCTSNSLIVRPRRSNLLELPVLATDRWLSSRCQLRCQVGEPNQRTTVGMDLLMR